MAESGFQNKIVSHAMAAGPWQFMEKTAKDYGMSVSWYIDERYDVYKSTEAAATYLKKLMKDFKDIGVASAAYNSGEGKMSKAIKKYKTENFWELSKGKYLKKETKDYVPKIMALAIIGKNLKKFGFNYDGARPPLTYDVLKIKGGTDLELVASSINISFEYLHDMNPEIVTWFIPHCVTEYYLKVPKGSILPLDKSVYVNMDSFQTEYVGNKTKLKTIAKKHKIKLEIIADLNKLSENASVKNRTIILPFKSSHDKNLKLYSFLTEKNKRKLKLTKSSDKNKNRS